MMKLTQVMTRSSLAAVAFLNLSLATSAIAEPVVVTRGPNRAAHVVKTDRVPTDAKQAPNGEVREFPQLVQKGPGGAAQIAKSIKPVSRSNQQAVTPQLIQRGPNGAFTLSNR